MERAASEAELGHVFPPEQYPYPTAEVLQRWRRLLRDRQTRVSILEQAGEPVGFVAFGRDTVLHLGVVPEQTRRGFGSALLEYATAEMFALGVPSVRLWVLIDNGTARAFYRAAGWTDGDQRRDCEFPPQPEELQMIRVNPGAPRRSRAT
jgi:ribosomal protein S18 acetylase RimI-like enzyme